VLAGINEIDKSDEQIDNVDENLQPEKPPEIEPMRVTFELDTPAPKRKKAHAAVTELRRSSRKRK
jgi:hypothetical protein